MKKILLSVLFMLFSWTGLYSQTNDVQKDHWYFGVGGGFHSSFMNFSDLNDKMFPTSRNLNGGVFTLFGQYEFGKEKHFAIRPEIALLQRGGKLKNIGRDIPGYTIDGASSMSYKLKAKYFDIRMPFIYQFCKANATFRPYVYAAPILGFATSGDISIQSNYANGMYGGYGMELTEANMAETYFAAAIGAGVKYQFTVSRTTCFFGLEASYSYGFTDTYGNKEKDGNAINAGVPYTAYKIDGSRKFSGIEVKATLGIPFSVFKKKPAPAVVEQTPAPIIIEQKPKPAVEKKADIVVAPKPVAVPEKPCFSLEEIKDLIAKGESVKGKIICSIDDIVFEFGKSNIKEESFDYLNELAEILKKTSSFVEVKGHTDNIGTENFNLILSGKRAQAVVKYLVSKGVCEKNLSWSAYGMSRPKTTNDTKEGRKINRRVEFEILK